MGGGHGGGGSMYGCPSTYDHEILSGHFVLEMQTCTCIHCTFLPLVTPGESASTMKAVKAELAGSSFSPVRVRTKYLQLNTHTHTLALYVNALNCINEARI